MNGRGRGGPVFVVGLPRSGTKLLRDLLNNHPRVWLSDIETEFLPIWIERWARYGDLSAPDTFLRFYALQARLPYFQYRRLRGEAVDPCRWYRACEDYSVSGVFEALIRGSASPKCDDNLIWGDKSPSYLRYIGLLSSTFPEACFIHIIRDVRDYCLSVEKAWGKNKQRAAQRWVDYVEAARRDAIGIPGRYAEVRYEDLLARPEGTLRRLCQFLDIEFDPDMVRLEAASEQLGEAAGQIAIVQGNTGKYPQAMTSGELARIEAISGHLLRELGYPVSAAVSRRRVTAARMRLLQVLDGWNLLRFNLKRRGFGDGVRFIASGVLLKFRLRFGGR